MLDVEKVKTILQTAADDREKSRKQLENVKSKGNKFISDFYERRYLRYCVRFGGMCDMLFELGYIAWSDDNNNVFVEKRVDGDIASLVDEKRVDGDITSLVEEIPF